MAAASASAVALTAAIGGNLGVLATVGAVAAEAGGGVAPYVQGGGSAAAVAGLLYVARLIIKGELVSRPVAETERETLAAIRAQAEREAEAGRRESRLEELVLEGRARESTLASIAGESARLTGEVEAELRYWRDQRERRTG